MLEYSAQLAQIRFGFGAAPSVSGPSSVGDLLADVGTTARVRIADSPDLTDRLEALQSFRMAKRMNKSGGRDMAAPERQALRKLILRDTENLIALPLGSPVGFGERLVQFWADHFAVAAKNQLIGALAFDHIDAAIRPNINGSFDDLLIASTFHPAMLVYLDQPMSVGPNSRRGKELARGLNENLAREILELHTLGVDAPYGQRDVTEFAELLTGLRINTEGFRYAPGLAEPGPETVLGRSYGAHTGNLEDIESALRDIARHPSTARHIARKLATHFIADTPPNGVVDAIEDAFLATDGHLAACYDALLHHPEAWEPRLTKVKRPLDFVISSLRGLGVDRTGVLRLNKRDFRRDLVEPLAAMGQQLFRPPGPDGWPEAAEAWVTPSMLAARIEWATNLARWISRDLSPKAFVDVVLGEFASPELRTAATGAETQWEGVSLALASPEFNRR